MRCYYVVFDSQFYNPLFNCFCNVILKFHFFAKSGFNYVALFSKSKCGQLTRYTNSELGKKKKPTLEMKCRVTVEVIQEEKSSPKFTYSKYKTSNLDIK